MHKLWQPLPFFAACDTMKKTGMEGRDRMSKYSVLICDDSKAIHSSLTSYLKAEGIDAVSAYDGETALNELRHRHIDVMVLDVMLPGMDGYEVCREARRNSDIYIIMLSAKGEELDRIVGLEMGADDYVCKPFSPRELIIRIKRALKRLYARTEAKKLTLAELTVLPDSYKVYVRDQEVKMTSKEIDVLSFLVSNAGKVLTREHILNAAWGYEYYGDTRVVDTLIKRLRQKLLMAYVHFVVRSIYGVGYTIEETT